MFPSTNRRTPFLSNRPILLLGLALSAFLLWSRLLSKEELWILDESPHLTRDLVIAATTTSNLTWLPPALSNKLWTPHIYITDNPDAPLTVPTNKGNEAMVYLTYIIQNYHTLPDIIYFHHDHEYAWHQIFSPQFELQYIKILEVQKQGYVSPRCLPGCENIIELDEYLVSPHYLKTSSPRDIQIATLLKEFHGTVPPKIAAPCCAQFLVSKEAVMRVPLDIWRAMRMWLEETELDGMAAGRMFEYTWHIWFGMEPVHCPEETQCLCDVFGVGECADYGDTSSS